MELNKSYFLLTLSFHNRKVAEGNLYANLPKLNHFPPKWSFLCYTDSKSWVLSYFNYRIFRTIRRTGI